MAEADEGDPETAAEFRRGIRARFDDLERQRRTIMNRLARSDETTTAGTHGDPALLDAIPQLDRKLVTLPENAQREIYDAFQLQVHYDGRDRGVKLQATLTADLATQAGDVTALAAAAGRPTGCVDQPFSARPRQEQQTRAGRATSPLTCTDALIVTWVTHAPKNARWADRVRSSACDPNGGTSSPNRPDET